MNNYLNQVHHIEALELMRALPDASVDAIITDPPYNLTNLSWESVIDWTVFWQQARRILKSPNSPVALFCQQPFTTDLIISNRAGWRYEIIWHKTTAKGFLDANRRPLREHEHIQVFADANPTYYPQFELGEAYRVNKSGKTAHYGKPQRVTTEQGARRYPTSVWRFSLDNGVHPTQKPLALMERLVLTYSEAGAIILDPFCGSGTTGVAARNTGRQYILGDMTPEYVEVARKRLGQSYTVPMFDKVGLAASAGG